MATWTYLDSYLSSIPDAQRQNLLNLIYGQVLTGQITTTGQYQTQLNSLLAQIAPGLPAPVFTQYVAPFQSVTRSPNYNAMETQAIAALGILYNECNLLDEAITDYQNVVEGNLDAINATVAGLEAQISALELLSANTDGYTQTVYDSFNESNSYRLTRSQATSSTPFIVPGVGFVPSAYDAQIINDELQLPVTSSVPYTLAAIALSGFSPLPTMSGVATSSDLPVAGNPYDISNILLNDPTQYWAETVDLNTLFQSTVSSTVKLTLAGTQRISNIFINPFTRFPYNITNMTYTVNATSNPGGGGIGGVFPIPVGAFQYPFIVDGPTNISFPAVTADSVSITISQSNYSMLRYVESASTGIISNILDLTANNTVATASLTDPSTYYFAMTNIMQDLLNIGAESNTSTNTVSVYEFLYGAKQIQLSQNEYANQGIFVTQPYTINNCAAIGLHTQQNVTGNTSIEYNILVDYYDNINGVSTFAGSLGTTPIMPNGQTFVNGEVLDGGSNVILGYWSATTRLPVEDLSTVSVLQNGATMLSGAYNLTQNPNGTVTVTINFGVIPEYIVDVSVFTIDYRTPLTASIINLPKHDQAVITLQIYLRSITPDVSVSPTVSSYSLQFKTYTGN